MRPEPPLHDEDAESAQMNIETVEAPEVTDINELRHEIDRLDAAIRKW